MASPVDAPLVCPVIVGRAPHVLALAAHLDALQTDQGGVLLIAGEAGIGKSRLVGELRAMADARGLLVLETRCFEPDRGFPLSAPLGLLRAYLSVQPREAAVLGLAEL